MRLVSDDSTAKKGNAERANADPRFAKDDEEGINGEPGSELEAGGEGFAKIAGKGAESKERFGGGGLEDAFHFGGDLGALLITVHAERSGEFVGDIERF